MSNPLISVIIPSFNYGTFLVQTVDNVVGQDYQEIELIIIDDGSTDDTQSLIAPYLEKESRIKYYFQENSGLSAARNLGLQKASGEYIQFLDADDLISTTKFKLQLAHFEKEGDLAVSYTNAFYFPTDQPKALFPNINLTDESWMPKISGQGVNLISGLLHQNIMPVNAALIKKAVLASMEFDTRLKSLEDWDLWLDLSFQNFRFAHLENDQAYALIRVHPVSMSQNRARMFDYEVNLRLKIEHRIKRSEILTPVEKDKLELLNRRRIKVLLSMILQSAGLFNFSKLSALSKQVGISFVIKAYLKALNDRRIQH